MRVAGQDVSSAFSLERREGYVFVRQERSLESVEEAQAMLEALQTEMAVHETSWAVIDQRGIDAHSEDVREAMWTWAQERGDRITRIAILADSDLVRVRVNMTAVSRGLTMRAFGREDQAEAWLSSTSSKRPTTEMPPVE